MEKKSKYTRPVKIDSASNPNGHSVGSLITAKKPKKVMQLRRQALNDLSDLIQSVQHWEIFYLVPERKLTLEEWQEFERASELKGVLVNLSLRYNDGYMTNNITQR